ncbi:hypothetical protein HK405_015000, partial [Cladochytrium tenue]
NSQHKNGVKTILFVRPRDPRTEIWDGPRCGLDGAVGFFGADEAQPISKLSDYLATVVDGSRGFTELYTDLPTSSTAHTASQLPGATAVADHAASAPAVPAWSRYAARLPPAPSASLSRLLTRPPRVLPLASRLAELRLIKSDAEVAVMREAGKISGRAFVETMAATKPDVPEYVLQATMEFGVRRRGADGLSFVPVVAAGPSALTVHYVMNKGRA